jgi:Cu(I)/Ag(I) efflux system protein CusF
MTESHFMKYIKTILIFVAIVGSTAHAQIAIKPSDAPTTLDSKKELAAAVENMADAEVRKIDLENKKITLRHGFIKNLDMPAMSMVFNVRDVTLLEKVKVGDKVKFYAEKLDGVFVVTTLNFPN